jgi:hypothetical protein
MTEEAAKGVHMSKEEKLMNAAIAATGDESITDVAEFNPKGSAGASAAGAAAGSLAGGAATGGSGWGKSTALVGALQLVVPSWAWGKIFPLEFVLRYHPTRSISSG